MKKLLAVLSMAFGVCQANAQQINLVVPFNPGGLTDIMARAIQNELAKDGHQAVVMNRPGGDGMVALNEVVAQKPNSSTLLVAVPGASVIPSAMNPEFNSKFSSLVPVILLAYNKGILVASKNSGLTNFDQLRAEMKSRSINFGSSSLLVKVIYQNILPNSPNVNLVPFNGEGPVVTQLLGNHIDVAWLTVNGTNLQHVSNGNLVGLAVASKKSINQIKTLDELKLSVPTPFVGVFAPPGTSDLVRDKLNSMLAKIITQPEFAVFYTNQFIDRPDDLSADNFARVLAQQSQIYRSILTKN